MSADLNDSMTRWFDKHLSMKGTMFVNNNPYLYIKIVQLVMHLLQMYTN
jgi:hypothetical protein